MADGASYRSGIDRISSLRQELTQPMGRFLATRRLRLQRYSDIYQRGREFLRRRRIQPGFYQRASDLLRATT